VKGVMPMNQNRKAARTEFRHQVRSRIRLLAAERGLPESEVNPVISRLADDEIIKVRSTTSRVL
jgi:hypothetical protein